MTVETRQLPASGYCDICGNIDVLYRTYFRYEYIKCECHSPSHFELVDHCSTCVPKEPTRTSITFTNIKLHETFKNFIREERINSLL